MLHEAPRLRLLNGVALRRMLLALAAGVTVSLALQPVGFVTAAEAAKEPPDLTQGAQVDRSQTYNLGATGLRGWIHSRAANVFDGVQGLSLIHI